MALDRRLIFLALLCLTATACGPAFKYPLSDPGASPPDEQLCGVWRPADDKEVGQLDPDWLVVIGKSVGKKTEPNMKVLGINVRGEQGPSVDTPSCFPTSLAGKHYLNFSNIDFFKGAPAPVDADSVTDSDDLVSVDEPRLFVLVKYQLQGDRLTVWLPDRDGAQKAIEQGKLKGIHALQSNTLITFTLTSPTDELRQFVVSGGDSLLFPDKNKMVFIRVK
jgi:hypothetical protein